MSLSDTVQYLPALDPSPLIPAGLARRDHLARARGPPVPTMAAKYTETNAMTGEEFKAKTDNYEKVMDRTWYCIANNMGGSALQQIALL